MCLLRHMCALSLQYIVHMMDKLERIFTAYDVTMYIAYIVFTTYHTVSVLGQEEGYTVKYGLILLYIPT